MALQLGNSTINDIINEINQKANLQTENTFTHKQTLQQGATISIEPAVDQDVATKKYVDDTVANNASSNITKIQLTIDSMTANQDKEVITQEIIPDEENKIAFISFSNDTNSIGLEAGIILKSVNPTEKKFVFTSSKDVTQTVKIIVTFI